MGQQVISDKIDTVKLIHLESSHVMYTVLRQV